MSEDMMVTSVKVAPFVPRWYMAEVEAVAADAKLNMEPFGALYTPDLHRPVMVITVDELDNISASSPRYMGMFDPKSSGMEQALTLALIHQFKREPRAKQQR